MADNRKYYYLKLKESYFDEDAIVLLESMQDGMLYSNILLKLYLKSLKNGGKLQLDENIPYTAQMIATITRQQVGTVERALQIFMKLGLVEPLQNGALYMSNIELLIGQSSTEGERKRRARRALQEQKALPEAVADICPPEIEKEIDIELEIKREGEIKNGQTARTPFGRYENVFLLPPGRATRTMPPLSGVGRLMTRQRGSQKRESPIILSKRARAFDSIDTTPRKQGVKDHEQGGRFYV